VAFRVLGTSAAHSRFEATLTTGLTPLVGREEEVGLLRRRWEQVIEGHGQVVLLSGEAGIGKSRLVQELRQWIAPAGGRQRLLRCSPYTQQSALHPGIAHVQEVLSWQRDDAPAVKLHALEQALQGVHVPLQDAVPLVAALLSLPHPESYPPLHLSPQRQKQRTGEVLRDWLLEDAERQPLLVIWEDLHWADPSSLEWLGGVLEQVPTVQLLMLLTHRPEFRLPWPSRAYVIPLALTRLTRSQIEALVTRVAGGKSLPAAVVQHIVAKTDGVPLFVEELVKTVLESDLLQEAADHYTLSGPLSGLAIPTTLHDALMARLDRLGPAKGVAQLAAVLGREFAYELPQAVAGMDEAALQHSLAQLVEAELFYQRGQPPQATYTFKHALIQDTAYQSLLRSTRQQSPQHIAHVLEERFPDTVATCPELLAYHYTEAGLGESAVTYWQRAGELARSRGSDVEAMAHFHAGLDVLTTLPVTQARMRRELDLYILLALAYIANKGQAVPDGSRSLLSSSHGDCPASRLLLKTVRANLLIIFGRDNPGGATDVRGAIENQEVEERLVEVKAYGAVVDELDAVGFVLEHIGLGPTVVLVAEFHVRRRHRFAVVELASRAQPESDALGVLGELETLRQARMVVEGVTVILDQRIVQGGKKVVRRRRAVVFLRVEPARSDAGVPGQDELAFGGDLGGLYGWYSPFSCPQQ
jgi:hypothetical protein